MRLARHAALARRRAQHTETTAYEVAGAAPDKAEKDTRPWHKNSSAFPTFPQHHPARNAPYHSRRTLQRPHERFVPGYAQGNLIVLPKEDAYDFLLFAMRNPKPCPILEVSEVGDRFFHTSSADCDIANDFPRYRVYRDGVMVDDPTSVEDLWRDDLVAFLIGCSFSFESELIEAGIEMRHNTQGRNVSMYITNIACEPAGKMSGNMVVSMRPIPYDQVVQAITNFGRHSEGPRRTDSHRRPVGHRHRRYLQARFRRCGRHPRGRGARSGRAASPRSRSS